MISGVACGLTVVRATVVGELFCQYRRLKADEFLHNNIQHVRDGEFLAS